MIIKVCGMRDEENIRQLEQLDIDWMGFIFYHDSPRYAGQIVKYLPSKKKRVGVFVDQNPQIIRDRAKDNHLFAIQLHGSEPPWYCINLREEGYKVIKSFGIDKDGFIPNAQLNAYEGKCDYFLFDTKTDLHGGSGKKFNWNRLADYKGETPFILSGGISPEDVEEIKSFSHPKFAGIDINSRFEISPAIKDVEAIKTFIKQLR
ncbi:MAG: phosphoribosylanthranilate isomerase [Fermentimonas sp.]|nr:phosphoribosylanthranilate isomerase [Fermentimonas sp.]MDD4696721.1 phosphoribosylanthranilate isomerase [Fermentimonas sp.]